jgi:glycosyltransferase involved in cell wall biosynthesis
MKLLIISHTPHYFDHGQIVGWGPTVREIDHLATLFTEVEHLAPLHPGPAPASALPYMAKNIQFSPVRPAGGERFWDKLRVLGFVPYWVKAMCRCMASADVLHIRCPAGISLVSLVVVSLWGSNKPIWVKYAGNWQPDGHEPLSYQLQRWLLHKDFHRNIVTVNGSWPNQPKHIITFNNPSMTQEEYNQAAKRAKQKSLTLPIQLLFVGRIDRAKGVDRLLEIAAQLRHQGLNFTLTLVGDSPHRQDYEAHTCANHLSDQVKFTGWLPMYALQPYYQQAHLLVFPSSASEGWPKVLSEAMAFGVVPVSSAISSIPQILDQIGAGKAIPSDQISRYVEVILEYADNPAIWEAERDKCITAGVRYTYPAYLQAVQTLFKQAWQIDILP